MLASDIYQPELLEISVPPHRLLHAPYMFYLKHVIPIVGRLLLGNPENYRLLGVYTQAFRNCARMHSYLAAAGLDAQARVFFFGCATGIVGRRPEG